MGWRFRKSVRLASFIRLNFSGSGVSLGLGPRGANVNISKRGVRQTVGLPGSGISHQSFSPWTKEQIVTPPPSPPMQEETVVSSPNKRGPAWPLLVVIAAMFAVLLWAMPSSNREKPDPTLSPPAVAQASPAEPVVSPQPEPARPLTLDEVKEVQSLLKSLGFDPGGADGIVGPMTIAAVKRYEPTRGWPASGEIDRRLLDSLRASKASPPSAIAKPDTPASRPSVAAPSQPSPPVSVVPNEEMRIASRAIREAEHPCGTVAAAVRLSDGSVRAVCSNGEVYRVMTLRGELIAMKCSAAERMGIKGC